MTQHHDGTPGADTPDAALASDVPEPPASDSDSDVDVTPGEAGAEPDTAATDEEAASGDDAAVTESIDEVRAERDALRDMLQRVQADFINFRKRSATRSAVDIDRATGRIVEALLPVLDAAEAAYIRHPDEVGPLLDSMLAELRRHGLEPLDLDGAPFDPEVAEAVAHESGAGDDVVVAEVLRSGYRWKGTTLRPAMVRTKD
ncbi:MAG: nucleotide exchange factor GrpE [Actinomycetota bacterium]|nr:nucleotide exchange factor GrpE [Actinomycetota bacterium]MDQ3350714.1 nucleotide exchange factor GrpE [Actinomycetota bacterium]